ncbi:MAG: hypothetical protein AAF993_02860 [Pseudomonadota bacterium]
MSSTPRVKPAVDNVPADFGSVTAHAAEQMAHFFDLYAEFWQRGVVAAEVKELTRLRNARITDCGY